MKILFLADGSSEHTNNWIQYFANAGHQIGLISMKEFPFKLVDNLTIYTIPSAILSKETIFSYLANIIMNPFRVKKIIREFNPDIIHAHYLTDYGLLGYFVHFPLFVVTVWGSDIFVSPKTSFFDKIMAKKILNSAKLITCDSQTAKNECLKYCEHPEKIKVIQWGLNLAVFPSRKQKGNNCAEITVLSTRNFNPNYNIDTIIEAIPFVIEKYPKIRVILKNYGGKKILDLKHLAHSLMVIEYIEFIDKILEYNDLLDLINSADIFISVPTSDSSSIDLQEAMACGLAVIVSDISANHEWIIDGWNGFIVPLRNPEKLALAIIQLIENPDLMLLFGRRNLQIIKDRADREKHMKYMENLYQKLI